MLTKVSCSGLRILSVLLFFHCILCGQESVEIEFEDMKASIFTDGGIRLMDGEGGVIMGPMIPLRSVEGPEGMIVLERERPFRVAAAGEDRCEMFFEEGEAKLSISLEAAPAEGTLPAGVRLALKPAGPWPGDLILTFEAKPPLPGRAPMIGLGKRDEDSRITRVRCGLARDLKADTLFDPESDRAFVFQGAARVNHDWVHLVMEPAGGSVIVVRDFYRKGRNLPFYAPLNRLSFPHPPGGWCSWYIYYLDVTEEEMKKNTDWLAEHLRPFGLEYVQLDDGYQLLAGDKKQAKSWIQWNDKFPSGHRELVKHIHNKGFKAGLWLTPFSQGDEELVKQHPEWFLRDEEGDVVHTFKGELTLDASNDEVLEGWFKPLFQELAQKGKWDYFKIDGQTTVTHAYRQNQERFHQKMPGDDAYRRGLSAIREAIGPGRYLLNCWGTAHEGIGYVNGARTGGDVWASWHGILPAREATRAWYYTHNICWHADPDVLCVRPPLTLDQARLWASLVGLTGQLLMASDKMYELPEDRVEILRRIYPVCSVVPMDFYPLGKNQLDIIDLKIDKRFRKWDVVGLFNWTRKDKAVRVDPEELGLEPGLYLVHDFWEDAFLGMVDGAFSLLVPKQGCRVISIVEAKQDRPTLVGASRHVTMGGVELMDVAWNPKNRLLSGLSSKIVKGDHYALTFYLPEKSRHLQNAFGGSVAWPDGKNNGRIWTVDFEPIKDCSIPWKLHFTGKALSQDDEPCREPKLIGDVQVTASSIRFAWETEGGPHAAFRMERDGREIGVTLDSEWLDEGLEPEREYAYTVTVLTFPGQTPSENSAFSFAARTPAPPPAPPEPDVYLTDLGPLSATQGWGELGIDTSTEGNTLTIAEQEFKRGLGTHARSEIEFEIQPEYVEFTAYVGVDGETPYGSVIFEVWLDGERIFASPLLENGDPPHPVNVGVAGKKRLRLVVLDGGDNIHYDHADWARAGFIVRK